jgi:chromosome segregation ATPase
MNYRELSQASGLKYDTVRNYAKILLDEGLVKEIDESSIPVVKKIPEYTASGFTVKEAAHKAFEYVHQSSGPGEIAALQKKLSDLERENESLRSELQKSKEVIENLKRKLESLPEEETPATSEIVVYRQDVRTAADAFKKALKSAGQGFAQFIHWLFDTESEKPVEEIEENREE